MTLRGDIAAVLRMWRAAKGWRQRDVPGVHQARVSRWENAGGLTLDSLEEAADAYGKTVGDLMIDVFKLRGEDHHELMRQIRIGAEDRAKQRDDKPERGGRGDAG